jgi:hypothetical protein
VAVTAGCGGKDASLAGCLNGKGFLVQGGDRIVRGSSPGGVTFTLTLYASPRVAARAAGKRARTARVGRAIVDWSANPPHGQLSRAALTQIRACLDATTSA